MRNLSAISALVLLLASCGGGLDVRNEISVATDCIGDSVFIFSGAQGPKILVSCSERGRAMVLCVNGRRSEFTSGAEPFAADILPTAGMEDAERYIVDSVLGPAAPVPLDCWALDVGQRDTVRLSGELHFLQRVTFTDTEAGGRPAVALTVEPGIRDVEYAGTDNPGLFSREPSMAAPGVYAYTFSDRSGAADLLFADSAFPSYRYVHRVSRGGSQSIMLGVSPSGILTAASKGGPLDVSLSLSAVSAWTGYDDSVWSKPWTELQAGMHNEVRDTLRSGGSVELHLEDASSGTGMDLPGALFSSRTSVYCDPVKSESQKAYSGQWLPYFLTQEIQYVPVSLGIVLRVLDTEDSRKTLEYSDGLTVDDSALSAWMASRGRDGWEDVASAWQRVLTTGIETME